VINVSNNRRTPVAKFSSCWLTLMGSKEEVSRLAEDDMATCTSCSGDKEFNGKTLSMPYQKPTKTGRHWAGPARGFGYTVSWAFLFQVYCILWSKFGYKVFSFSWILGIRYMIQKFIIYFSVLFSFIMVLTWKTLINYQCSSTNQILAKSLGLSVSLQSDWDKNKIKFQWDSYTCPAVLCFSQRSLI